MKDQSLNAAYEAMNAALQKCQREFSKALDQYITKNLSELGYNFGSQEELIQFLKDRVTRIAFEERPQYYEVYIDYVDAENKGVLIGCYSDKVDFSFEGNKIIANIG